MCMDGEGYHMYGVLEWTAEGGKIVEYLTSYAAGKN